MIRERDIMSNTSDKAETYSQRELRILREYVHLLADAIDKSTMPFVAGYPDGKTMAFNEAFVDLTGYTEEELREMQWVLYLTPPECQEIEAQAMEELRRTGQPQVYEKWHTNKGDSRTPVEVTLCQTNDKEGKVQYYYALFKDLTDKKRADHLDKELQELKERNQYMVGTAFEGLAIVQDGNIVEVNEHYANMTGYDTAELMGMPLSSLVTPGLRGMVSPQLSGAAEGTFEVMLNRKDGRTFTVEIVSRDIMYKGKEARMDRVRDITEKRKAQEDKEDLMKQLATVGEELSELNQLSSIAVNSAPPQQTMETLLRNLSQVTRAESAMVMSRTGDALNGRAVYGSEGALPADLTVNIGEEFPGNIVKEDRWVFVEDASSDAVTGALKEAGMGSLLGVPIRQGSDVIGALYVGWKNQKAMGERDTKIMEMVADRCASALITSDLSERDKADEEIGRSLSEMTSTLSSALKFSGPGDR